MRIGMIPQAAPGIRREYAHILGSKRPGFRSLLINRNVSRRTDAPGQRPSNIRLYRYPSPSLWSGPLRVRPTLFAMPANCVRIRRQHADSVRFSARQIAFGGGLGPCAARSSKKERTRACGSELSPRQGSWRLRWRPAEIPSPNSRLSVQAQVPVQLHCWMATLPLARWLGRLATSRIATNTPNAAESALKHPFGQPNASEHAAPGLNRGGGFVLPVRTPRGPETGRAARCSRRS